jgi:Fe-S-cluster containining protein
MAQKNSKRPQNSKRISFLNDEKVHTWLPMLLEAYHIVDRGVSQAIESELQKGRKLACGKGCSSCCKTQKDIPVYPLELVGLSWYVIEKISGLRRQELIDRLKNFNGKEPCPFLIQGICAVHPVRPVSCRQFNVFGNTCSEGEDPYYTRREDVLAPVKKHVDQAFFLMLPFYGIKKEAERAVAIERGDVHSMVMVMQDCNWRSLGGKMEDHDSKNLAGKTE